MPGALRTAPYPAKSKDLGSGTRTALRSESNLSIVVICNYSGRPDNGGTMPGKSKPFTSLVDPISPPSEAACSLAHPVCSRCLQPVVEAPGTAPGSERLIPIAFITIVGRIRHHIHSRCARQLKAPSPTSFARVWRAHDRTCAQDCCGQATCSVRGGTTARQRYMLRSEARSVRSFLGGTVFHHAVD